MNRDYSHRYRDASRFGDQDRYAEGRSFQHGNPRRYEDTATHWNDEQTARWLSHYGGGSQRGGRDEEAGHRAEDERGEYAQGYGSQRSFDNPRYGQRFQESWEGQSPDPAWRQRGAERISPGMHGRYGWRGEDSDQGSLNFQPGEYGYGHVYGPTFGATYRHPEQGYEGDYGRTGGRGGRDENWYRASELGGGMHYGKGPTGYTRSDERIREDVCDRLTDDPHVDASSIQVSVENGVVTLQGQVTERQMKHRAEDCAEHVSGVKDVENRLRVSRDAWSNEGEGSNTSTSSGSNSSLLR